MEKEAFDLLVKQVGEQAALKIKAEVEAANKELSDKVAKLEKSGVTAEALEVKMKEASEALAKSLNDTYKGILEEQGKAITKLKLDIAAHNDSGKKSFKEALTSALEAQKEVFADIVEKSGKMSGPIVLEINKAAVTMGEMNTIGAGATQVLLTENTGIISPVRSRVLKYTKNVSVGSIGTKYALWVEESDKQGNPVFIAEGSSKIQVSSIWKEKTQAVEKIGVYGKVTTEMFQDLPQLVSYIQNSMLKRLDITVEDQLVAGDGVAPNLKGAKTWGTAFTGSTLALAVDTPNEFDVLTAIALQAEVANGIVNACLINPSTLAKMKTLKDSQHRPIYKDYIDPMTGDIVYAGMRLVTSNAITAGEFIGGDLTVLNVLYREMTTIQIGLDSSDFINNQKTILAEQRLVQFVSANDAPVLIKGDFDTAIEAITKA